MTKAEKGKSEAWRQTHCLLCGQRFQSESEPRVVTRATFMDDTTIKGVSHEACARAAQIQEGCRQTIRASKGATS